MPRQVELQYSDPLDLVWLHVAREFGITVVRSDEVFASWDGESVLTLGTAETLDADDCLAQMVLHELCHAFVEGPESWKQIDWGLRMDEPDQRVHELACMRVQAAVASEFGLRKMLAPTTNLRWYYDQLSDDPLVATSPEDEVAVGLAVPGFQRAKSHQALADGLKKTAAIAATVADAAGDSLWTRAEVI